MKVAGLVHAYNTTSTADAANQNNCEKLGMMDVKVACLALQCHTPSAHFDVIEQLDGCYRSIGFRHNPDRITSLPGSLTSKNGPERKTAGQVTMDIGAKILVRTFKSRGGRERRRIG